MFVGVFRRYMEIPRKIECFAEDGVVGMWLLCRIHSHLEVFAGFAFIVTIFVVTLVVLAFV